MTEEALLDPYAQLLEVQKNSFHLLHGQGMLDLICRLEHHDPARYHGLINSWSEAKMPGLGELKKSIKRRTAELNAAFEAKKEREREERAAANLADKLGDNLIEMDTGNPMESAQAFLEFERTTLLKNNGAWLDYYTNCYIEVEEGGILADLYPFIGRTINPEGEMNVAKTTQVKNIMHALESAVFKDRRLLEPPCWLSEEKGDPEPDDIISCRNGLLNVKTGDLLPHTPRFFTRNGLDFDYEDPIWADPPRLWLRFLNDVFEGDQDSINLLQEAFGYILSLDTKQQKFFSLIGPPRGGKGTIGRVLGRMIGRENTSNVDPEHATTGFGMQDLVGKSLLLFSDLIITRDTKIGTLVSMILRMTGEDDMNIARKFRDDWKGRTTARIFIISNAPLFAQNQAGALAARMIPIVTMATFEGREDLELTDKLLPELPGILNWSINGLRRLRTRGRFILPERSKDMLHRVRVYSAPVKTFVDECCDLSNGHITKKAELLQAYNAWADLNDQRPVSSGELTKTLESAVGMRVSTTRPRTGEPTTADGSRAQVPHYQGIRVKPEMRDDLLRHVVDMD